MERRWDMIQQKAQWEGDLRRFYLEKCCHEADRGPSNQTGLGMGLFFVGGGGVVGCGKVYN